MRRQVFLKSGDVLHARIKRAIGVFDAPEYMECLLQQRDGEAGDNALAFGNCIARVPAGGSATGFAHIACQALAAKCRCQFERYETIFEGHWGDGRLRWFMSRAETEGEEPAGTVRATEKSLCVELGLGFPSRRQEDSGRLIRVEVLHEGEVIGHILRSFNPVFHRSYRVGLWIRDVIPVYEVARDMPDDSLFQRAVIFAILGTWFCYAPIKGERSAG